MAKTRTLLDKSVEEESGENAVPQWLDVTLGYLQFLRLHSMKFNKSVFSTKKPLTNHAKCKYSKKEFCWNVTAQMKKIYSVLTNIIHRNGLSSFSPTVKEPKNMQIAEWNGAIISKIAFHISDVFQHDDISVHLRDRLVWPAVFLRKINQ